MSSIYHICMRRCCSWES